MFFLKQLKRPQVGVAELPLVYLSAFLPKDQYIGQAESFAQLFFVYNEGHMIRGQRGLAFLDNTGAMTGLVKGVSGVLDSAAVTATVHFLLARSRAAEYFEFVETDANISDGGSRFSYDSYREANYEVCRGYLPPWSNWEDVTFLAMKEFLLGDMQLTLQEDRLAPAPHLPSSWHPDGPPWASSSC